MNFLEELAAEWYEYRGYFVRTNIKARKRAKGGWDAELDLLAYAPSEEKLLHIETSGDADSWPKRRKRFETKKFIFKREEYENILGSSVREVKKIAIVGYPRSTKADLNWEDIEVVLVSQFIKEIAFYLGQIDPLKEAVPEGYPLLRSIQMALAYGKQESSEENFEGPQKNK